MDDWVEKLCFEPFPFPRRFARPLGHSFQYIEDNDNSLDNVVLICEKHNDEFYVLFTIYSYVSDFHRYATVMMILEDM